MRLWSRHPCYLDAKGLVALWREGLLARAVLNRQTRGYRHHPQLERFRSCSKPDAAIDHYLRAIYEEAEQRGYRFDAGKLGRKTRCPRIPIAEGQIHYEWTHLASKLKQRHAAQYQKNKGVENPRPHPLFKVEAGGIAPWERIARQSKED